jgi:hypothetical protein
MATLAHSYSVLLLLIPPFSLCFFLSLFPQYN